jgi:zinc protease
MKLLLFLVMTAVQAAAPPQTSPAAQIDVQPPTLKIEQAALDNGMKIVVAEDHARPILNLQVWYHVGSKNEREGRTGFAHLFEHMMFRGSKNVGPEEHMRLVREAGGVVNAYTSFDQTVYWQTVPSNYLERMIWLEADRMASLVVNEENFKKEREVVKEERRLRFENPPYGLLAEVLIDATFQVYPYKHMPIGSMDDLNKATVADVKEFFDTFYVPDNATLVVVGDVDAKQVVALARKHFGPLAKSKKPIPRVTVTEPPQTEPRELTRAFNNVPLPAVASAYELPPLGHPDVYALQIASDILSSGQSSRLYRRLVYEEQIAVGAAGQGIFLEGPSIFFAFGIANQGKDVKQVAASLYDVIEGMKKAPVTDEELAKAKNQAISRFVMGRQTAQEKADALGAAAVLRGDPEKFNTELANYQKVTAADVQRVCAKYLVNTNETRLWVQPEKK